MFTAITSEPFTLSTLMSINSCGLLTLFSNDHQIYSGVGLPCLVQTKPQGQLKIYSIQHFFPMTIRFILGLVHQTCLSRPDKASRTVEDIHTVFGTSPHRPRAMYKHRTCYSREQSGDVGNQSIRSCSWSKLHQ